MQRQRQDRARRALRQLPGDRARRARNRRRLNRGAFFSFFARVLSSGIAASLASAAAGVLCSRFENRHGARAMNAVAHIYDGGRPPAHGRGGRNTALGFAIHTAASAWWALFFESLPTRHRNQAGAAAVAALAYIVDYHVVNRRLRPGFEAHLSQPSLIMTYAALAAGYASCSALQRRLHHHQEENRDERDEGRPAERRPKRVIAPEALR